MNLAVVLLGVVVVGILLWMYMDTKEPSGTGMSMFDREPVLSSSQQATLAVIKSRAHEDIKRKMAHVCKLRFMLINIIREAKSPSYASEMGSCAAMKAKLKSEITRVVARMAPPAKTTEWKNDENGNWIEDGKMLREPQLDDYDPGQLKTISIMANLWMDKAFDQYCPDTQNFELFKEHAVRAINDICKPDGDFARMLFQAADYVISKPLSIMS